LFLALACSLEWHIYSFSLLFIFVCLFVCLFCGVFQDPIGISPCRFLTSDGRVACAKETAKDAEGNGRDPISGTAPPFAWAA